MSTHRATLRIDRDSIDVTFTCDGDSDSVCRQMVFGACFCERFSPEKVDGKWGHWAESWDPDEVRAWHPMQSGNLCNYIEWVSNDDARVEELYSGPPGVALNDTEVEFVWEGDFYEWRPKVGK